MIPRELIEFLPVSLNDGTRLLVLKSQYNRYAGRLNASRFDLFSKEHSENYTHLKYLKQQIDNYE